MRKVLYRHKIYRLEQNMDDYTVHLFDPWKKGKVIVYSYDRPLFPGEYIDIVEDYISNRERDKT